MKKTIVEALSWAFKIELPKVGARDGSAPSMAAGSAAFAEMVDLGTLVDRSPNAFGIIPDFISTGDAHPDAVLIGDAVRALGKRGRFEIPDGWNPLGDWADDHGLIAAELAEALEAVRLRPEILSGERVVARVISCAVLGQGPVWEADAPRVEMVMKRGEAAWFIQRRSTDSLGRVYSFETDGFDRKRRGPMIGAYRKYRLDQPIRGVILSRLDWQLWRDALSVLHGDLSGRLSSIELLPFRANRSPWLTAENIMAAAK